MDFLDKGHMRGTPQVTMFFCKGKQCVWFDKLKGNLQLLPCWQLEHIEVFSNQRTYSKLLLCSKHKILDLGWPKRACHVCSIAFLRKLSSG